MAIKRRSEIGAYVPTEERKPLVIVAADKKPLPEESLIEAVYGDNPDATSIRRTILVAEACGDKSIDSALTAKDRVIAMRTPYDKNNPTELRYRVRVRNRGTAITAMCIVCTGSRKLVAECLATDCPLWAFRLGNDPFFGRKK
jgi:hypothetical protein